MRRFHGWLAAFCAAVFITSACGGGSSPSGPPGTSTSNAPWASAVVEADGAVRPCYFHPVVGNIRERRLREILANEMVAFRRGLNVAADATCRRCVCTLQVGVRTAL